MTRWINAVLFQLVWFSAVIGAAHGVWWAGVLAVAAFAAIQLVVSRDAWADLVLIALALAIGCVCDSLLAASGLVMYAAPVPSASLAPIWILALWANLALSLNHSLAFMKGRLLVAAALGAVGAPLSYLAAARGWHAVALAEPQAVTLGVLAVIWALAMPLLAEAARRLERRSSPARAALGVRETS